MSKHHMGIITCPKCGKESDFMIWDSINTTIDPEMKDKVRTGEAFIFQCPNCGERTNVNYTTLYHQMEDNIMIYYVVGDPQEAVEILSGNYASSLSVEFKIENT